MKSVILKSQYSRRFPDPLTKFVDYNYGTIEHHILLMKAKDIPFDIPKDPNPREQNIDKGIYKRVRESLISSVDPTFHLKNKGITLIAQSVNYLEKKEEVEINFREGDGIVDGGHTYEIIKDTINKDECPENQYLKLEILTGINRDLIDDIAEGLNTAMQVQKMSLENLRKEFDWIKEILKNESYENQIAFKENETGVIDIREIIGIMTLFNIDLYPSNEDHPKIAYTSKASTLDLYLKKQNTYKKLSNILKDILYLYDYVQIKGKDLYNNKYKGKAGALAFAQHKKRGFYDFIFANAKGQTKLFDGALYPILGAFRFLVEQKKNDEFYSWKLKSFDEVKAFYEKIGAQLINNTKTTSDSLGKNPNAIGKDHNHWDNLYKTVALAYFEETLK